MSTTPTPTQPREARGGLRALWARVRGSAPALPPPVRLAEAEEQPPDTPRRPDYAELGISGTRVAGGRINGYEQNRDLTGSAWVSTAEEMERTDPAVNSAVRAMLQTLLSATWRFRTPDDASPQAQAAAEYLNEAFGMAGKRGRMRGGWEQTLGTMLRFVPLGHRYLEEVYRVEDGRVWLDRYADREPSAHQEWVTHEDTGELVAVTQQDLSSAGRGKSKSGGAITIPANKLILLTLDRTGQNYEGRGLLRPCYAWWRLKRHGYDMLSVGMERWAVPTPIITVDRATMREVGFTDPEISAAAENAAANAKNYVSHEQAWLQTATGVTFDTFGGDAFDPGKILGAIDICDQQIAAAFLLGFLRLGVNDTGSRSVGEVQETFFRRAAVNILDMVAQVVGGPAGPGQGTAGRLLKWNFPSLPEAEYPRLVHEGLTDSPLLAVLPAIPGLIQGGALTWGGADEADLRGATKLRPPSPEVQDRTALDRTASRDPLAAVAAVMAERARRV